MEIVNVSVVAGVSRLVLIGGAQWTFRALNIFYMTQ